MAQISGQRRRPAPASAPSAVRELLPLPVSASLAGWVLLPLRAFLAFVFLYAGISKVADRSFLDDSSPTGIHATLVAVRSASPIGSLLGPVQDHSFAFGLVFSIAEIAVGLGLLLGLFTRVAALGGMALSLSFFLTVSWGASPWYTGADIGYLFALTPLLIAGAGGVLSLDGWLAIAARRRPGIGEDRFRRALLGGGAAFGVLVLLGFAALGRGSGSSHAAEATDSGEPTSGASGSSPASSGATGATASGGPSSAQRSAPAGPSLVATAKVGVGQATQITDPKDGDPAYVLQLSAGHYTALSAVCPHQQCTVAFISAGSGFQCPCHGSRFAADGALLAGPATRGLTPIPVTVVDGTVHRA